MKLDKNDRHADKRRGRQTIKDREQNDIRTYKRREEDRKTIKGRQKGNIHTERRTDRRRHIQTKLKIGSMEKENDGKKTERTTTPLRETRKKSNIPLRLD